MVFRLVDTFFVTIVVYFSPPLAMPTNRRQNHGRTPLDEALFDFVIFLLTVGLLIVLRFQVAPTLGPVQYQAGEGEVTFGHFPVSFKSVAPTFTMQFPIVLRSIHPRVFAVQVDDCIEELTVNGLRVIPDNHPVLCSPHDLAHLDLGAYLEPGRNDVRAVISDIGVTEGMYMTVSNIDPLSVSIWVAILLTIVWYAVCLWRLLPVHRRPAAMLFAVLLFAVLVRLLYIGATPHTLRTYDLDGHLDYTKYMREHRSIPPAQDGWEFHQPPLYYALAGSWMSLSNRLSLPERVALQSLSGISAVLSILTFTFAFAAAGFLFSAEERRLAAAYGLLLATFTGFVFFASRITNEALSAALTMACILLMLTWWRRGDDRTLVFLSVAFALAFLTKVSILALAPAIGIVLLARKAPIKTRIISAALFSVLVLAIVGWYPAHRLFLESEQEKTLTLGNNGMTSGLSVPRDIPHLFSFNALAMLEMPFNDPWSDDARRGNFLEYFYRSSLFGEFQFKKLRILSQMMLGFGIVLLPAFAAGFVTEVRRKCMSLLPLHLSTVCLALGAFLYPFLFPFAPNQDFRFSVALVLPLAYYTVRGISNFPWILREIYWAVFILFTGSCAAFIGALFTQSS